jgi:hypothetical protein
MQLTDKQLKQYQDEGYVFLDRVLTDEQLEGLRAEEARFRAARGVDESKPGTHFFGKMAAYSPVLRQVITQGAHVEILSQLQDTPNVIFRHDQFVTKMPDRDQNRGEFPWHQDEGYELVEPALGVTVWIALDNMTLENGCIWVVPQSHKQGHLPHEARGGDGFLTLPIEGDGEPMPMKAGEAVAFTGLTLHRSKYNRTDKARRAFFIGYADASAKFRQRHETEMRPLVGAPHSWVVCGSAPLDGEK